VEVTFPAVLAEGLAGASPDDLAEIKVSPTGLGLHWPRLDAHLYVPALLQCVFGSRRWMASHLGAAGGKDDSREGEQPEGRRPRRTASSGA